MPFPNAIERIRAIQETTFGTQILTAGVSAFLEVAFREGTASWSPDQPIESPMHARQLMDGRAKGVLMPRSAKLEFECNLEALTTRAASTVAPTNGWLGQMLEAAFGGKNLTTGTTIAGAGATVSSLPLTTYATIHPGCAIGLASGAGSALECRELATKATATYTTKLAVSNAPANLAVVYGSASYFPDPFMDGSDAKSMQFLCEGVNPSDRWLMLGGALDSIELTLGPSIIPKAKFVWKFANYLRADRTGAPFGTTAATGLTGGSDAAVGSDLARATYLNVNTLVVKDSELRQQTNGTVTLSAATLVHAPAFGMKINISWAAHKTPSGVETTKQWVRTHTPPLISGSFTVPFENDLIWYTARDTRLNKMLSLQIGSSVTDGAILIVAPTVQILDVKRKNSDGILMLDVSWEGRNDEDCTAETSYEPIANAAFRIHIF